MSSIAVTKTRRRKIAGRRVRSALIIFFALVYLLPLYIAVSNSFKSYWDVIKSPLSLPTQPTMDNYVEAFNSSNILSLYGTSILITFSSVLLLVLIASTSAYIIIRRNNKLCKFLYGFALIGIMVPPVVTLVPSIKTLSMLGLMFTPWGLLLFYGGKNDHAGHLQFHRRVHFEVESGVCQRHPGVFPDRDSVSLHAETIYERPHCRRGKGLSK